MMQFANIGTISESFFQAVQGLYVVPAIEQTYEAMTKEVAQRLSDKKLVLSEKIIEQLKEINWFQVLNCDDVGKAWSAFHGFFAGVIDKVDPVKKVRLKQRSEPWITHEILKLN